MRQVDASLAELAFQADSGDADAQYRMGVIFLLGEAVDQDLRAACRWMARAAAAQHPEAADLARSLSFYGDSQLAESAASPGSSAAWVKTRCAALLGTMPKAITQTTLGAAHSTIVLANKASIVAAKHLQSFVARLRFGFRLELAGSAARNACTEFPEAP